MVAYCVFGTRCLHQLPALVEKHDSPISVLNLVEAVVGE